MKNHEQTILILLGPPGAGKGTVAVELAKETKLPHISTGDLFRENLKNNTPLGEEAKSYMNEGKLVPDELVIDMLLDRIAKKDCEKGYILDGFPRTIHQAEVYLTKVPEKAHIKAINLEISDDKIVERISGRLVCKNCGTPFHKEFHKPKQEGICDECGGELYQRKDDTEEVVRERLNVYHKETEPLIEFFEKKNILVSINSDQNSQKVLEDVLKASKS